MTKTKLPPAADWQARDIADWNITTFTAFISESTREKYGAEYVPGGGGSKSQRWLREKGMLKNAQGKYGNRVLRAFIEICWREYRTNKPEQYPYPSATFMLSFMDRHFDEAQAAVARENRRAEVAEQTKEIEEDWW